MMHKSPTPRDTSVDKEEGSTRDVEETLITVLRMATQKLQRWRIKGSVQVYPSGRLWVGADALKVNVNVAVLRMGATVNVDRVEAASEVRKAEKMLEEPSTDWEVAVDPSKSKDTLKYLKSALFGELQKLKTISWENLHITRYLVHSASLRGEKGRVE